MADVFVSYASRNRDRVAGIAEALKAGGWSAWWDRSLASGADYGQVIEREIAEAHCVVVAWSAIARESLWVRAEANEALDAGKLLQLSLDGAKLPLPFTMLHFLDFTGWSGGRERAPWPELEARVGEMAVGEHPSSPLQTPTPDGPRLQGLGLAVVLGWAALTLGALMGAAVIAAAVGALPPGLFGPLAAAGFALAAILLAAVTWLVARTLSASRR